MSGLAAGLALMLMATVPSRAQAQQESIMASANYGFAGAAFDWAGPGRASNINLVVADWGCDANPVYSYFRVTRTNGQVWTTSTRRWDYSGCDNGDYSTYNGLSLSDGFNIAYLQLYICRRNGGCTLGGYSSRNPFA